MTSNQLIRFQLYERLRQLRKNIRRAILSIQVNGVGNDIGDDFNVNGYAQILIYRVVAILVLKDDTPIQDPAIDLNQYADQTHKPVRAMISIRKTGL